MGTTSFSKEVYEQIAQNLVSEQAELLKHQTLVEEYKIILVEGKKQLIRKLVKGNKLYVDGKHVRVLEVKFSEEVNKLGVTVIAGLDPFREVLPNCLTKREKQLLDQYKIYFRYCNGRDEKTLEYILEVVNKLSNLKNNIDLGTCYYWTIDMINATLPDFFSNSGLTTGRCGGPNGRCLMFEELTRKDCIW